MNMKKLHSFSSIFNVASLSPLFARNTKKSTPVLQAKVMIECVSAAKPPSPPVKITTVTSFPKYQKFPSHYISGYVWNFL